MRISNFALAFTLVVAFTLGACVPDVVSIEAVPTTKFSHALAQCNAQAQDALGLGNSVKRCMKAKGYRFLRQY